MFIFSVTAIKADVMYLHEHVQNKLTYNGSNMFPEYSSQAKEKNESTYGLETDISDSEACN